MKVLIENKCNNCPVITKRNKLNVIALVGPPNVGKSTLFNILTGLKQHTGNWSGKTLSSYSGTCLINNKNIRIIDLPGIYSLRSFSLDENATKKFLENESIDLIIVIMDPLKITRSLNLLIQIIKLRNGKSTMGVFNLMDEAKNHGVKIDFRGLSTKLMTTIIPLIAREKEGILNLKKIIEEIFLEKIITNGCKLDFNPLAKGLKNLENLYILSSNLKKKYVIENNIKDKKAILWQKNLDDWLTSKWTGIPIMVLILAGVFWITIIGANYPSDLLRYFFIKIIYNKLILFVFESNIINLLWDFLVNGLYLSTAWVIAVMLPPVLIFFPLFTLLEDFGYLPRVAFNMDALFNKTGGNGKQSLTMAMGYGCNAAGVIASRIIESPRERLLSIITNNFAICNGRWPLQILMASTFIGVLFPPAIASFVASISILMILLLGLILTLISNLILSKTLLKGKSTFFVIELPPYRKPKIWSVLYRSLIDRTSFVLFRAIFFALPAGALTWILVNVQFGDNSLAALMISLLEPLGSFLGLSGIILLAYIIAIPANELVIPAILMLTVLINPEININHETGLIFEIKNQETLKVFLDNAGWTLTTAICLMVFSLCHNPCSTTLFTIYKETKSVKWTIVSTLLPLIYGCFLCTILRILLTNIFKII